MTYSRLQNPTVEMLEERIALLEGAEACRTMATGMAAMTAVLLCQLQTGDHVVAGRAAFGSCRWLTDTLLPKFGIETTIVDARDPQAFQDAVRPKTKVFFFETPSQSDDGRRRSGRGLRDRPRAGDHQRRRQCLCDALRSSGRWNSART